MKKLTGVRVLNRYDMDGLDDELYHKSVSGVFAEPAVDMVYEETGRSVGCCLCFSLRSIFRGSMTRERIPLHSAFSSSAWAESRR